MSNSNFLTQLLNHTLQIISVNIFVALAKIESADANEVNIESKDCSLCNQYLRQMPTMAW